MSPQICLWCQNRCRKLSNSDSPCLHKAKQRLLEKRERQLGDCRLRQFVRTYVDQTGTKPGPDHGVPHCLKVQHSCETFPKLKLRKVKKQ